MNASAKCNMLISYSGNPRHYQGPKRAISSGKRPWFEFSSKNVADSDSDSDSEQRIFTRKPNTQGWKEQGEGSFRPRSYGFGQWPVEPELGRVVNGMANRADRIKAIGNGQVPRVAATAWEILSR